MMYLRVTRDPVIRELQASLEGNSPISGLAQESSSIKNCWLTLKSQLCKEERSYTHEGMTESEELISCM